MTSAETVRHVQGPEGAARERRGRSLFWTVAGIFLLTAVVGTLFQWLVAVAVLRPLEVREARARAELATSGIANEIASAPSVPRGADLDSLLARHRVQASLRPAFLVFRSGDGSVVTSPTDFARFLGRELGVPGADTTFQPRGNRPPARLEVIARREVMRGSTKLGEIQVVRRIRTRGDPGFFSGDRTTLLFLPIAIIVSMGAGLFMVRLLVTRLRAMEVLATRVAEGDLSVRIADRSGDEIGRLASQLDRMTERLASTRDQLETNEQQRRQLFADITHELATPLTSIRGYAETMLDPSVPTSTEERAQYVRGVLDESRRLDRLIRDLLELARLEAGAAPLAKEPIDWAALCRNTIERFEPRFRKAGLRLEWRPSVAEAWIEADGHCIEQVLDNLLMNALRYVPEGGTVELALERVVGEPLHFRLTVSDDGPGLPAAELPNVFERFYRGTGARGSDGGHDPGGSGLGLAIVREIVERHGGTAHAEPRAPHGLTIAIELPGRGT